LPDSFIEHDTGPKMYDAAGLNAAHIVQTALAALGHAVEAVSLRG
jgi:1-deoxy-D-xylulose-5-phosphate synthase